VATQVSVDKNTNRENHPGRKDAGKDSGGPVVLNLSRAREQNLVILLSSSIPVVITVGFACLAHAILLWLCGGLYGGSMA
jgi:hypothetical protein